MSDEPYTSDQNMVMESGIPVRLYNGGKQGGASTSVPCFTDADDGDVLTIVGGEPSWEPPGGSGLPTTVWPMLSPFWLVPYGLAFAQQEIPFPSSAVFRLLSGVTHGTLGFPALALDEDDLVIGSGSGVDVAAQLPATSDGQTLVTPRAGYDVSFLRPYTVLGQTSAGVGDQTAYWQVILTLGASRDFLMRVIHGASPATDGNTYIVDDAHAATASRGFEIPSAINTTSSNSDTPTLVATLSSATTWSVSIKRCSFML